MGLVQKFLTEEMLFNQEMLSSVDIEAFATEYQEPTLAADQAVEVPWIIHANAVILDQAWLRGERQPRFS